MSTLASGLLIVILTVALEVIESNYNKEKAEFEK